MSSIPKGEELSDFGGENDVIPHQKSAKEFVEEWLTSIETPLALHPRLSRRADKSINFFPVRDDSYETEKSPGPNLNSGDFLDAAADQANLDSVHAVDGRSLESMFAKTEHDTNGTSGVRYAANLLNHVQSCGSSEGTISWLSAVES